MRKQLAMIIDPARCIDCKACLVACGTEHGLPAGLHRNWVRQSDADGCIPLPPGVSYQPGACMHCDKAPCVDACPTGASRKDPDTGEVIVDKGLCIGCGKCVSACPYAARYMHPVTRKVDKCDYCAARRRQGLEPACVATCPTKVRIFGDINDPASPAAKALQGRVPVRIEDAAYPSAPNMYYISETHPADWPKGSPPTPVDTVMRAASTVFQWGTGMLGLALVVTGIREYMASSHRRAHTEAPAKSNEEEDHG